MTNKRYIIPFFIPHIGCPHSCVFCSQNKITGREKPITPEEILPIIRQYRATFSDKTKKVEVAFFGGSFTGIPIKLRSALLQEAYNAKKMGLLHNIRLSTRPDYIDEDILNHLKDFEVDIIELGVQSMDSEVLALSQRGHGAEDVIKASKLIKGYGFKLGLQMMIGLPGSHERTEIETAVQICRLKPDFVRIYPALVIRGTKLEDMYKNKTYRPPPLQKAVEVCVKLSEIFIKKNINIIRIGLQPTGLIKEGGEVAAGPFHPSFRQLVDSRLVLNVIVKIIGQRGMDLTRGLAIMANPRFISTLQGINKENLKILKEMHPGSRIRMLMDKSLKRSVLRLETEQDLIETDYLRAIEKGIGCSSP